MTVQQAELVSCERDGCYASMIYLGNAQGVTARDVASASGWQVGNAAWAPWDKTIPDVCPACLAGRGPIMMTACPNCGGCGGNLICTYCGAEQPRDVEV